MRTMTKIEWRLPEGTTNAKQFWTGKHFGIPVAGDYVDVQDISSIELDAGYLTLIDREPWKAPDARSEACCLEHCGWYAVR